MKKSGWMQAITGCLSGIKNKYRSQISQITQKKFNIQNLRNPRDLRDNLKYLLC